MFDVKESTPTVNLGGPLKLESPRGHTSEYICENISREVYIGWKDTLWVCLNLRLDIKGKEEEAS